MEEGGSTLGQERIIRSDQRSAFIVHTEDTSEGEDQETIDEGNDEESFDGAETRAVEDEVTLDGEDTLEEATDDTEESGGDDGEEIFFDLSDLLERKHGPLTRTFATFEGVKVGVDELSDETADVAGEEDTVQELDVKLDGGKFEQEGKTANG